MYVEKKGAIFGRDTFRASIHQMEVSSGIIVSGFTASGQGERELLLADFQQCNYSCATSCGHNG